MKYNIICHLEDKDPKEILRRLTRIGSRLHRYITVNPRIAAAASDSEGSDREAEEEKAEETSVTKLTIESRTTFMKELGNRQLTSGQKLQLIVNYAENDNMIKQLLDSEIPSSALIPKDKTWFLQTIQTALVCLRDHFAGDISAFIQKHAKFTPSRHCKSCSTQKPCTERDP